MSAYSGWWNWSTTCGSGGPKRRANPRNCEAVSFCPRNTSTWSVKNAFSISPKAVLESGRARSTSLASRAKPRSRLFSRIRTRPSTGHRLQVPEQRRYQLRDRGMDVHRALHGGVGLLRVHHVQQRMHDLVAVQAEDRRAEQLLRPGVGQDLHEALRLAGFLSAADTGHRHLAGENLPSALAGLGLVHPDSAEGRVDKEGVARNAIGDPARIVVEEIGGDDLVVVPRRVRERTLAVRVAHAPYAVGAGAALVVDGDVAARIGGDAGLLETEVVGIRRAADGEQQVAALGDRLAGFAFEADDDASAFHRECHALGAGADHDTLALENGADFGGDVVVFARQELVEFLDHGDFGAEAAVGLRKLEADIAAADDDEVLGHAVHFHYRAVGQVGHLADSGEFGHERAAADVEEDPGGLQRPAVHVEGARGGEARVAADQGDVLHALDPVGHAVRRMLHDAVLARLDRLHVHAHVAGGEAVFAAAPRRVHGARRGHQGLGGNAADVDAGAAHELALDDRGLQSFAVEARAQRRAGLSGADDDGVVAFGHGGSPRVNPAGDR